MNTDDAISLHAFLIALTKVDFTVIASLQPKIKQIGKAFTGNEAEAINQLRELSAENQQLKQAYQNAYDPLCKADEERERSKHFEPGKKSSTAAKSEFKFINTTAPIPPDKLKRAAMNTLNADNIQKTAASELKKANDSPWWRRLFSQ